MNPAKNSACRRNVPETGHRDKQKPAWTLLMNSDDLFAAAGVFAAQLKAERLYLVAV